MENTMRTATKEEIETLSAQIKEYALSYGLDPFDVVFELVDFDEMSEIAAYDGFPQRYLHWRFGMEYERLSKSYTYGLSKIYELVINTNPAVAFLMTNNTIVDQKLVIAHVYAHSDFFKNNMWFKGTNRKMADDMAMHASRIYRYINKYGHDVVEEFIDKVLSLENLIDYHWKPPTYKVKQSEEEYTASGIKKFKAEGYMEIFVNPPELLLEEEKKKKEELKTRKEKFPIEPAKDVLLFLMENAPLELWQEDIISIIREEAYYFVPQALTKIMNEGWAAFWHEKILTEKALKDHELIDFAEHHAGVLQWHPGSLNPYKLGYELFKDIEERWNKGRFGKEYEECEDLEKKKNWDLHLGLGLQKIFEVRKIYSDVLFLDEFLTDEFCKKYKLFVYKYNRDTGKYEITSRNFNDIKRILLRRFTNLGHPIIIIVDANYENRGELYLLHKYEDWELDYPEAKETLKNLQYIWRRPVHLETVISERRILLSYNGKEYVEKYL
ncbi:MAG: SpoVR family protein [Planctomycetota bacterium]